jgi:hypothetical protein
LLYNFAILILVELSMNLLCRGTFVALALMAASVAHADVFTLTSGGTTISFTLPGTPTVSGSEPDNGGFYLNSVAVDVNGTTSNKELAFYLAGAGTFGGLSIEDANQGADFDDGTGLLIDQSGSQLFSGTITSPTFLLGSFALTNLVPNSFSPAFTGNFSVSITSSAPPAITPEPSSVALLTTGLVGVAGMLKRRYVAR